MMRVERKTIFQPAVLAAAVFALASCSGPPHSTVRENPAAGAPQVFAPDEDYDSLSAELEVPAKVPRVGGQAVFTAHLILTNVGMMPVRICTSFKVMQEVQTDHDASGQDAGTDVHTLLTVEFDRHSPGSLKSLASHVVTVAPGARVSLPFQITVHEPGRVVLRGGYWIRDEVAEPLYLWAGRVDFRPVIRRLDEGSLVKTSVPSMEAANLIAIIKDTAREQRARMAAMTRLAWLGDDQAIPVIIAALDDKNEQVRFWSIVCLKAFGPDAIAALPKLIEMAPGTWYPHDGYIAGTMASLGPEAVPSLVRLAASDRPRGRLVAACALSLIGTRLAIPKDQQEGVGDVLISLLKDKGPFATPENVARWHEERSRPYVGLLSPFAGDEALESVEWHAKIQAEAAEALVHVPDPRSVPFLIDAFADKNGLIRLEAAQTLRLIEVFGRETHPERSLARYFKPALDAVEAKRDRLVSVALAELNGSMAATAAELLAAYPDRRAMEPLKLLLGHPSEVSRAKAVEALGALGDPDLVSDLVPMLNDPAIGVRDYTVVALGKINSEKAVDALIGALSNDAAQVRWRAADELGRLKVRRAVPVLMKLLRDDYPVSGRYMNALEDIGDPSILPELRASPYPGAPGIAELIKTLEAIAAQQEK